MQKKKDMPPAYITVLKLKLQLTKDLQARLREVAELCRRGRNAGAINWLLRQHGLPLSESQAVRKVNDPRHIDKPKSESTLLYHAIRAGSPGLSGTTHSMLAQELNSHLSAKVDWRRGDKTPDGQRRRRGDAIMAGEDRPPWFTAISIPVRAIEASLRYGDASVLICRPCPGEELQLSFSTSRLTGRYRRILQDLSSGRRKLQDAKLIYKAQEGEWFYYLPVTFDAPSLQTTLQAELRPVVTEQQGQLDRPFHLHLPEVPRPWSVGDGRYLVAQCERLATMIKSMGRRYQWRSGPGHGRADIDVRTRKVRQRQRNVVLEVRRRMLKDIVRQCLSHCCGTLLYREPSLPLRDKAWFTRKRIDWDWTAFRTDLANACKRAGITLVVKQLNYKEALGGSSGEEQKAG